MISDKILTLIFVAALFVFFGFSLKIKNLQAQRDTALVKVNYLSAQIEIQNEAVKNWKQKSVIYAQKYDEVQKEAKRIYAENSKSTEQIMNFPVPRDCSSALKWGVKQALMIQ